VQEGGFKYEADEEDSLHWYANFADAELFGYYGSNLFAQDEIQAMEHPVLASLREALNKKREKGEKNAIPVTSNKGIATPCVIRGVPRWCSVDTRSSSDYPTGLYGNNFSHAPSHIVIKATTFLNPPTLTNLYAIDAPKYGRGAYTEEQIVYVISTAYTAFMACRHESYEHARERGWSSVPKVVCHTGNWGCGAYGGNITLMAICQLIAARFVCVDTLVYHTFRPEATLEYRKGEEWINKQVQEYASLGSIVDGILKLKLMWGVSDGT
jgi:hypothetical protein